MINEEPTYQIDGDSLANTPLPELADMLAETPAGSTLRASFRAVVRVVAVHMLGGAVPHGMTARESSVRARELLELLSEITD